MIGGFSTTTIAPQIVSVTPRYVRMSYEDILESIPDETIEDYIRRKKIARITSKDIKRNGKRKMSAIGQWTWSASTGSTMDSTMDEKEQYYSMLRRIPPEYIQQFMREEKMKQLNSNVKGNNKAKKRTHSV